MVDIPAEILNLSLIECRNIVMRLWEFAYVNPETGEVEPDREIRGADAVDALVELLPNPGEDKEQ